jgi:hypothetical protein
MATLTKEELKNALISHGIARPSSTARKEEYVALYEQHIAPREAAKGDFSSDDDDEVTISPRKRPTGSATASKSSRRSTASSKKTASRSSVSNKIVEDILDVVVGDTTVGEMTDEQLFVALRENGVDAGPIVDSTRDIYKRKLAAVVANDDEGEKLDESVAAPTNGVTEFSDTEPESVENSVNVVEEAVEEEEAVVEVASPVVEEEEVVEEEAAVEESPRRVSTRSSGKKMSTSSAAVVTPPNTRSSRTGLRQRFGADQVDTSDIRNTPTPRRSIHSYKVTETTTQLITRTRDGKEVRDSTHTIVTTDSSGVDAAPSRLLGWTKRLLRRLLQLFLLAGVLFCLYLVYLKVVKSGGGASDSVVDKVRDAIQEAVNKAEEEEVAAPPPVTEAPAAPPPPPPSAEPAVPEQPSLADV